MNTAATSDDEDSGGNPSLEGWLYQCDVSVFAALDLMLAKRKVKVLRLEPVTSQEDIEGELDQPLASSEATIDGIRLVIQAKLRRTGQWTAAKLKKMVEHGKRRKSANQRIADTRIRYILVTTEGAGPELSDLHVDDLLEQLPAVDLPTTVFPAELARAAAGRFAILDHFTEARVKERINTLLFNPLCVPSDKHDACRAALRQRAWDGMRRGHPWLRSEVEAIIKSFGGSIPSERDVDFVEPKNWSAIIKQMDTRHAMVITGPSGTGKTTVAEAVARHYQKVIHGLNYVKALNPEEIREREGSAALLFYVDDPWGKYAIRDAKVAWSSEIKSRLRRASRQQMLVITSRSDILQGVLGDEKDFLRPFEVRLDPSEYDAKRLGRIYESRVRALGSGVLKTAALRAKQEVLEVLETPFEIDQFVGVLRQGAKPKDKDEDTFVARVLEETQRGAIEEEVKRLVKQNHCVPAAAIVWALLAARGHISREDLPTIRRGINRRFNAIGDTLEDLVNMLVAGGTLRQPHDVVTYAHPRVENGLLRAMRSAESETEEALNHLATALVTVPSLIARGGIETAAHLLLAMETAKLSTDVLVDEVRDAIDAWLETQLQQDQERYASMLRLAAQVGSEKSVPAEISRWLEVTSSGRGFFLRNWKPGERTEEWYAKARAHPATQAICDRMIRLVLTVQSRGYPKKLATYLDRITDGLDDAWLVASDAVITSDANSNVMAIAFGAMRRAKTRAPLLQKALDYRRAETPPKYDPETDHWPYVDGHFNDDIEPYFDGSDEGFGARELVSSFVEWTHEEAGWQALASHPDLQDIAWAWVETLRSLDVEEIDPDELISLVGFVWGSPLEGEFWRSINVGVWPCLDASLEARLLEGHDNERLRLEATRFAMLRSPRTLAKVSQQLLSGGRHDRLIELIYDTKSGTMHAKESPEEVAAYRALEQSLPEPFREIARSLTPLNELESTLLSAAALEIIAPLLEFHEGDPRVLLVWIAAVNHRADEEVLRRTLFASTSADEAEVSVRAAEVAECWSVVRDALSHPRGRARALAVQVLARPGMSAPPEALFQLVSDPSHYVRRSLVDAIAARPPLRVADLVTLCADTWAEHSSAPDQGNDYPIAVAATEVLSTLAPLPPEFNVPLIEVALETEDDAVCEAIFKMLAKHGDDNAISEIVNQILTIDPRWPSVVAARALASSGRRLPNGTMSRANTDWFRKCAPVLAAAAARVIGSCSDDAQILQTADFLIHLEHRRVLLIALALGAHPQSPALTAQVLERLPPGHPAANLLAAEGTPLKHDLLDDLGDIRLVNAVLSLAGSRFEPRPSVLEELGEISEHD